MGVHGLRHRMLLSATPIINCDMDLQGVFGLLEHPEFLHKYQHLRLNTFNPYDCEDSQPESMLQCTQRAAEVMSSNPNQDTRAEMMSRSYNKMMLKRTYGSDFEGEKIGETIPPHKKTVVHLEI